MQKELFPWHRKGIISKVFESLVKIHNLHKKPGCLNFSTVIPVYIAVSVADIGFIDVQILISFVIK
jgi:hypothetical protein